MSTLWTSKTLWGAVVMVLGWLAGSDAAAMLHLPGWVTSALIAFGGVLTAIGLRGAITGGMTPAEWAKSKSLLGVIALAVGYLGQPDVMDLLNMPDWVSKLLVAIGGLLTAYGFRTAVSKSGGSSV